MVRLSRCQFWDCTAASDWHEAKNGGRREEDDGDQSSINHPPSTLQWIPYIVELCIHTYMHACICMYIYIYIVHVCLCGWARRGERERERQRERERYERYRDRERNKRNCTWLVRAIYLPTYPRVPNILREGSNQ